MSDINVEKNLFYFAILLIYLIYITYYCCKRYLEFHIFIQFDMISSNESVIIINVFLIYFYNYLVINFE